MSMPVNLISFLSLYCVYTILFQFPRHMTEISMFFLVNETFWFTFFSFQYCQLLTDGCCIWFAWMHNNAKELISWSEIRALRFLSASSMVQCLCIQNDIKWFILSMSMWYTRQLLSFFDIESAMCAIHLVHRRYETNCFENPIIYVWMKFARQT